MATSISRIFSKIFPLFFLSYFTCFVVRLNCQTDQLESRRWPDGCPAVSFTEFFSKLIFHESFLWIFTSFRSLWFCFLMGRLWSPDQSEATSTSLSWNLIGQFASFVRFQTGAPRSANQSSVDETASPPCGPTNEKPRAVQQLASDWSADCLLGFLEIKTW